MALVFLESGVMRLLKMVFEVGVARMHFFLCGVCNSSYETESDAIFCEGSHDA